MEEKKIIHCMAEDTVRKIINRARKLDIKREDIVQMFVLGGQVYLIYYK